MIRKRDRALRNYRHLPPAKFHTVNQRISTALTDNPNIPESTWAGNPTLLQLYLELSKKHDAVYHQATYGSKLDIAQRELLQAQLVAYLDEIVLVLEAAAVRNPDILLTWGFDLVKERRNTSRTNVAVTPSDVSTAEQHE